MKMKRNEHAEQSTFFDWIALNRKQIPALWNCYAVPNAAKRSYALANYMRKEGLATGYPDINLDFPSHGYHGLRIEMKVNKNEATLNQKDWHRRLLDAGYQVFLCYSAEEAIQKTLEYLKG